MNKLAEILKRHIWCVITIAAIILLALITLSFGKDVNLVSHLSLTSAVVSIVLAVIVIVYMYFQDQRSSQNIIEMRRLIDEGYHTMTDKAGLMVDKAQSIEQRMAGLMQSSPTDSKPTTPPLEIKEPLQLDISIYGTWGLLTLYSLAKSYESGKAMSWWEISKSLYEKNKPDDVDKLMSHGFGVIQSFRAFLGRKTIFWRVDQQKVKKLPDGFKKSVTAEIDKRLKKYKDKGKDKDYAELKDAWDSIDDYFDNL